MAILVAVYYCILMKLINTLGPLVTPLLIFLKTQAEEPIAVNTATVVVRPVSKTAP